MNACAALATRPSSGPRRAFPELKTPTCSALPARLGWEDSLADLPSVSLRLVDGGVVIDYALGNLRRPRHSLSSRTLFKLVLLLSAAALGSSVDAQQATKIPKVGGRRHIAPARAARNPLAWTLRH